MSRDFECSRHVTVFVPTVTVFVVIRRHNGLLMRIDVDVKQLCSQSQENTILH